MEELEAAGKCLLCPEVLFDDPRQEILHVTAAWIVARNLYPYAGAKAHYLLIPRDHVSRMDELNLQSKTGFWGALEWLVGQELLSNYGLGARNGDPTVLGATIAHFHMHAFSPADDSAVRMKFGH